MDAAPVIIKGKISGNKDARKRIDIDYTNPSDAVAEIIKNLINSEDVCGNAYYVGYMAGEKSNVCFFSIPFNTNKSLVHIDCEMRINKLTILI